MTWGDFMRRRDFLALVAVATAWSVAPRVAVAQIRTPPLSKSVGVIWTTAQKDAQSIVRQKALTTGLAAQGWTDARNVTINNRWGLTETNQWRSAVSQFITAGADAIVTDGGAPAL